MVVERKRCRDRACVKNRERDRIAEGPVLVGVASENLFRALLFLGHRMIMRGGFRGVGPWGGRDRMGLERLSGELSLDSDQKKKIEAIMSAHRDQIHRLLEESRSEIRALLRPEQQTIFDRLGPRHPGWHGGVPGLPPGPPEPPSPAPEPPR